MPLTLSAVEHQINFPIVKSHDVCAHSTTTTRQEGMAIKGTCGDSQELVVAYSGIL